MKHIKEILDIKSKKLFRDYVCSINKRLQKGLKKLGHNDRDTVVAQQIFWVICRYQHPKNWESELKLAIQWEGKNSGLKRKRVQKALRAAGCNPTISKNFAQQLDI